MNDATAAVGAAPRAGLALGQVRHTRLRPVVNAFAYPTFFLMLPMRALRHAPEAALPRNRFGWVSFHDADHGEGGDDALAWIETLLRTEGLADRVDGEIWLQTYPRVLGHVFKPVSFWYCHQADGRLAAVVAEVNNTFGERHFYLLDGPGVGFGHEMQARKVFHVSPFCAIEGRYRFRFMRTDGADPRVVARIEYDDDDGPLLLTSVSGTVQPVSAAALRAASLKVPLLTLGVVARIHWQALRLWLRRVPFHAKPEPPGTVITRQTP